MSLQRTIFLTLAKQPLVKKLTMAVPMTRDVVRRFVPGETLGEAMEAVSSLVEQGLKVTVDVLGEDVTSPVQASANVDAYLELLEEIGARGYGEVVEVSLKLSALGQFLPDGGEDIAFANGETVCRKAADVGSTVTLDMEDHTTVDSTLGILRRLREHYPHVGCVLQAYLYRTADDARDMAGAGSRVRLCKGAYNEPDTVAFHGRRDVDSAYVRSMATLMAGEGYPMLATHDPRMISIGRDMALQMSRGNDEFEFQMLYGVRSEAQKALVADGYQVRVYLPFGPDWYGYFMRRLAERPANLVFFLRSFLSKN